MTPTEVQPVERQRDASPQTCYVRGCRADASYIPVLHLAQRDRDHISQVELPIRLCASHRTAFSGMFLTAQRRAAIENALTSRRRAPPDWSRTAVEFLGP